MGLEGVCVGLVAWVWCFSALSFLCCCVFQAFVSSLSLLFLFSRVFQPFPFSLSLSVVSSAHLFLVLPSSPFFPLSLFLIPCAAAFSVGWGSRFQTLGASWASLELLASSCLPGGVAVRSLSQYSGDTPLPCRSPEWMGNSGPRWPLRRTQPVAPQCSRRAHRTWPPSLKPMLRMVS